MKTMVLAFAFSAMISGCGQAQEAKSTSEKKDSRSGRIVDAKTLAGLGESASLDPKAMWKGPRILHERGERFALMIADPAQSDPQGSVRIVLASSKQVQGAVIVPKCDEENYSIVRSFDIKDGLVRSRPNEILNVEPYLIAQAACADRSKGTPTHGSMRSATRKAMSYLAKPEK